MPDMNFVDVMGLRRLGPARVVSPAGAFVEVEVEGRSVLARMAVAGFYAPVAGDCVLLIEAGDAAYVIGVLAASGPVTMTAPGDLNLLARGRISLTGAEIALTAGRLSVMADSVREQFKNVRRVVAELLDVEAGEICARVAEVFSVTGKRVKLAAEEDVKVDGKQIHLG